MGALVGERHVKGGGAVITQAAIADVLRRVPFSATRLTAAHEGSTEAARRGAAGRVDARVIEGDIDAPAGLDPPHRYRGPAAVEPGVGTDDAMDLALEAGGD